MKFEFTDKISKDTWIEEYPSFEGITKEMIDGATIVSVFECTECKKEIRTENHSQALIGLCLKCSKSKDKHIPGGDDD